jgi:Outer membrane protein beta-barrel domain
MAHALLTISPMRFPIIAAGALAAAAVVLSGNSARADATPTGIEVGLRSGYALPIGDIFQWKGLGDGVNGAIPIWIDAGYRFRPNAMIGAFFQYGIGLVNPHGAGFPLVNGETCGGGSDCSASDIMFGVQFHYHLLPDQTIDPWGGVGLGYEILDLSDPGFASTTGAGGESYNGFFANLQIGADYKATPNLGVGPFVMFSLGEYSGCSDGSSGRCLIDNTQIHGWLTFGIRAAYDINL